MTTAPTTPIVKAPCLNCLKSPVEPASREGSRVLVVALAAVVSFAGAVGLPAAPAAKPKYRFTLPDEDEYVRCVAFSPDGGKVLAGTNFGNLWMWELTKKPVGKKVRLVAQGLLRSMVLCLAVSPDGSRALAGCADNNLRVVDLKTLKVTQILRGHTNPVFSVCFSRDGRRAFSGNSGGAGTSFAIQWNLKTYKKEKIYKGADIIESLAISPDQRRLLTTEFDSIPEWDIESGKRLRVLKGHEKRVCGVFYSKDGRTIISGSWEEVRVWDAKTGRCLRSIWDKKFNTEHCALSPSGRRMLLGGVKEMQLLDLKTGKAVKYWGGLAANVHVAFSPDGRYALSGEEFGPVSVWTLPDEERSKKAPGGK